MQFRNRIDLEGAYIRGEIKSESFLLKCVTKPSGVNLIPDMKTPVKYSVDQVRGLISELQKVLEKMDGSKDSR